MCWTVLKTVEVPQLRFVIVVVDITVAAQRQLPVWVFTAVNMQRQASAIWVSILCRKRKIFHRCSFWTSAACAETS